MKDIPNKSVDMILCDLPYNVTRNKWDVLIPFDALWEQYNRIITDNGAIVLFAQGMFTSDLMQSNKKMWRYNLIWDKVLRTGFLNDNRMPLRQHEDICVFYKKLPIYNPQKIEGEKASNSKGSRPMSEYQNNNYGKYENVDNSKLHGKMKFPTSILRFEKPHPSTASHPTQKPIELCEWLIRTYTNENMTILDNCMGSGTTGVATINVGGNRKFIGIELDEKYFNISCKRLENAN
jgi:site-specific DNA-methyltransferase (adenine-specific)